VEVITGREAVLAAAGDSPYARLNTHGQVTGYLLPGTTAWVDRRPTSVTACAVGDPGRAAEILSGTGAEWLHLPRATAADLARLRVAHQDDWEFLWTAAPPPPQPGEPEVTQLTPADEPDIAALLDGAFPDTTTRPGDPRVVAWFGIRERGRLIACAADRSRGGVGFLAGLAVTPDRRGRGLGAALTAAVVRHHLTGYGVSSLGVLASNTPALRLYRGLGFTQAISRTSVHLRP
jgi:ribosomal protein S18 acetylase RimI-like enzyme